MVELKRKVTLKRKVEIPDDKPKSKLWLWLLLVTIVIVAVVFVVIKWSSNGANEIVTEKVEHAITKANEITAEIQNPTVNLGDTDAKIEEAQKAIDDAKLVAKTDEEKQAVAEAQAKVDEARQTIEQEKISAETKTPVTGEEVTSLTEHPSTGEQTAATESALPATPAQPASEKPATTAQNVQSATSKTAVSTTPAPIPPQGTLEEKAWRVIRGDFGNGLDRKQALGSEYDVIQQKVNELYRNGKVN
jgi:FtsZ-interacting cell division protein ZipA